MASIKRRGNFWQARVSRYVQDGKRQYVSKSGFRTKKEAEIYANQAEIEVQKTPLQKRLEQPFYDYFDDWYTTYRKPKISEASQRAYVHTENQLKKYFNDRSISAISRKDYQDFISIYGKNHAPKTVKRLNNLLNPVLIMLFMMKLSKRILQKISLLWLIKIKFVTLRT